LLDDAIELYKFGRTATHVTSGAIAAALRAIRKDGQPAKVFFSSVFSNRHDINDKSSASAQRLATWLTNQYATKSPTKSRSARGITGFGIQREIAERAAREYLAWRRGGDRRHVAPQSRNEMPEEFAVEGRMSP
jgi:hypothetical protein